ncbi:iron uptake porin [Laspinema sp. D1]|uniref:iron uptake porin n=1 Tax=Laspinema palackyanum TaxID=3231601 RepID=UPI0034825413|nr:iron uptake porin [Laspinema sp. D2b]
MVSKLSSIFILTTPLLLGFNLLGIRAVAAEPVPLNHSPTPVREPVARELNRDLFDPEPSVIAPLSLENPRDEATNLLQQIEFYSQTNVEFGPLEQVNSVSELTDVSPNDWAFQALQNLASRYQCLLGYGDGTFQGNRAMTRYEFASNLNACLEVITDRMSELDLNTGDLDLLTRLTQDFSAELATLRSRVDNLELRTVEIEANQFSPTTKLAGEAAFILADAFADEQDAETVFSNRVRLNFVTSFTGRDNLFTRLEMGNIGNSFQPILGTNEGRFAFDGANNNTVTLNRLHYFFPLGDKLSVRIFANAGGHQFYANTLNPFLESGGGATGALSRFAERNPIYRFTLGGAGLGVKYTLGNNLEINAGYLASEAKTPLSGAGLFDGNYSTLGQIVFGSRFQVGLTYIHAYEGTSAPRFAYGGTGTNLGNLSPAALNPLSPSLRATPVVSNSYSVNTSLRITPNLIVGGWIAKTSARLIGLGDADIWNYAATVVLPDLGTPGSFASLIVGAEPHLTNLDVPGNPSFAKDTPFHVEGLYKYQITPNISLTPGVIWLTAPNQNNDNSDVFIGTFRTTFTF